jgi:hypothetical protein
MQFTALVFSAQLATCLDTRPFKLVSLGHLRMACLKSHPLYDLHQSQAERTLSSSRLQVHPAHILCGSCPNSYFVLGLTSHILYTLSALRFRVNVPFTTLIFLHVVKPAEIPSSHWRLRSIQRVYFVG